MAQSRAELLLLLCCVLTGLSAVPEKVQDTDVIVGQDVELQCRYSPNLTQSKAVLTWIRVNREGHTNVAIGETPFAFGYTLEYKPQLGRYDLKIKNASYDRDNGEFECRMTEKGSGNSLHSSKSQLVVLMPPSQPSISPDSMTATEGKATNLTCSSLGGSPPPDIKWYKNGASQELEALYITGRTRDEPTQAVLTIDPKKEDDNSVYRCTVWNRAIPNTGLMEASTTIRVNYFPRVTVGPENPLRVEREDTAVMNCQVDAKPRVNDVKWVRDGRFIQQTFKHQIPRVGMKDGGKYTCEANNGLGQVGKAEVMLDVLFGPEVVVPPMREVASGESVLVDCEVTANPGVSPQSIVWTKEGDPEFRQTGSQLRISGSKHTNNGRYTCSATNVLQPTGGKRVERHGNATVTIAVRHRPGDTFISPETPVAMVGKAVTMKCGASPPGHPAPTYSWWKEGSVNTILASSQEYTIDSATLDHGGKYYCQPKNNLGSGTAAESVLQVFHEPKIQNGLERNIKKRAGDTGYNAVCSAVAKPKPTVKWFKDGVEITDNDDFYRVTLSEQPTLQNKAPLVVSTLKFEGEERINKKQIGPKDRGEYTCQFENDVGQAKSTMKLMVEHSPVTTHKHNRVAADPSEVAIIPCRMQAYPKASFTWSKEGSMLNDPSKYVKNVTQLKDDIFEGILRIQRVDESSYGEYTCKAINRLGTKKTKIKLQRRSKPEVPKHAREVTTAPDSILLTWDEGFDGGYSETTYTVEYGKIGDGDKKKRFPCKQRNPCNITGLKQHTAYQFKVRADNIRGHSRWSQDISVTTAVDVSTIPTPFDVRYAKNDKKAEFSVHKYPLALTAKIELQSADGTWEPNTKLGLDGLTYGQAKIDKTEFKELKVKLCLTSDEDLCGQFAKAEKADFVLGVKSAPLEAPWLIAVLVVVGLLAIAVVCLVIKCFCCKTVKPKKLTKEDIAGPRVQPNGHPAYNYGMDNKGVSTTKDTADSPDIIKSQMYGYNYPPMPAAQVPNNLGYDQSGSSNSNNGGSVNSQDSLWNVKHPNGDTIASNGYVANGYYPDPHHQQQILQQQQQQYQQQQQQQLQQPQQQYNYDDYTHYPHPEEYLMAQERNRSAYFANGDQYAMPNKPRHRLDSDYSPYGDVSGLPDPYTGHDISDELRHQTHHPMDGSSHAGVSLHSSDMDMGPPPPEGYSTPSRRVIREIIV